MKRLFFASFVIFLIIFSFYYYKHGARHRDVLPTQEPAISVEVVKVQRADIPKQIQAVGTLLADQTVDISPEIAGQVAEIFFKEGSIVKKGTPLIQLDNTIYRAALKASEADLALSQINYNRMVQVVKQGAEPRQSLDRAQADLQDKKAAVDEDKAKLEKMTLLAPFDGELGRRTMSVGSYVQIGQGLLKIVDKQHLRVHYRVSEQTLAQLKVGQIVDIASDILPGQKFQGNVIFISPDIDSESHSLEIEALLSNSDGRLTPGAFVRITHNLGFIKDALIIPEQALMPSVEGQNVYKVVNGKSVLMPVDVGMRFAGRVQILKGLLPDDDVVIAGQQKLKDGSLVKEVKLP